MLCTPCVIPWISRMTCVKPTDNNVWLILFFNYSFHWVLLSWFNICSAGYCQWVLNDVNNGLVTLVPNGQQYLVIITGYIACPFGCVTVHIDAPVALHQDKFDLYVSVCKGLVAHYFPHIVHVRSNPLVIQASVPNSVIIYAIALNRQLVTCSWQLTLRRQIYW